MSVAPGCTQHGCLSWLAMHGLRLVTEEGAAGVSCQCPASVRHQDEADVRVDKCVEGPDVWQVQAQPQVHGWHCTCQMPVSWQCWLCRASVHGASDGVLHCVEGDKLRRTKCDGVPRVDDVQFCRSLLPGLCCLGYAAWALLPGLCCLELCSSCDCQPSCCPRTPSDALETCAAHII
jgi:hypothetical protein